MSENLLKPDPVPSVPVTTDFGFDKMTKKVDTSGLTNDKLFEAILKNDDVLPWGPAYLPSKGLLYGPDSPVPTPSIPDGLVQVRPMGLDVEKLQATARYSGKFVDLMIDKCVQLPEGFNQLDLLSGDRLFLLFYIRGVTYGNKYQFSLKCPACDVTTIHDYDLNELGRTIKAAEGIEREPFRIVLPFLSEQNGREVWVKARFERGRDLEVLNRRASFRKRVQTIKPQVAGQQQIQPDEPTVTDESLVEKFCLLVTEVLGNVDPHNIRQFVEKKLHSRDAKTIDIYLSEKCPNMSAELRVTCSSCSREIETTLPITNKFFRPADGGGAGA